MNLIVMAVGSFVLAGVLIGALPDEGAAGGSAGAYGSDPAFQVYAGDAWNNEDGCDITSGDGMLDTCGLVFRVEGGRFTVLAPGERSPTWAELYIGTQTPGLAVRVVDRTPLDTPGTVTLLTMHPEGASLFETSLGAFFAGAPTTGQTFELCGPAADVWMRDTRPYGALAGMQIVPPPCDALPTLAAQRTYTLDLRQARVGDVEWSDDAPCVELPGPYGYVASFVASWTASPAAPDGLALSIDTKEGRQQLAAGGSPLTGKVLVEGPGHAVLSVVGPGLLVDEQVILDVTFEGTAVPLPAERAESC